MEKLVDFRSPRQLIQFFAGLCLLFSLNATERKNGRTDLIGAVVLEIVMLSCDEAYARFPREAQGCNLKSRCAKWGSKTVQCLVLDPNSIGVAHDIQHLSVGNHGLVRQIDETNRIARFCRSNQLGTTETVQLSTGENVSCTYTRTWPIYPDAEISDRAASPAAGTSAGVSASAVTVAAAAGTSAGVSVTADAAAAVASATAGPQNLPTLPDLPELTPKKMRVWIENNASPKPHRAILLTKDGEGSAPDSSGSASDSYLPRAAAADWDSRDCAASGSAASASDSDSPDCEKMAEDSARRELAEAEALVDQTSRDSQKQNYFSSQPTIGSPNIGSPAEPVLKNLNPPAKAFIPLEGSQPALGTSKLPSCRSPVPSAAHGRKGQAKSNTSPASNPSQPKISSFFTGILNPSCRHEPLEGHGRNRDDDMDDSDAAVEPLPGAVTDPARQVTCSGTAEGGGSGTGGAGTSAGNKQLATLARLLTLLKEAPHSHSLEASVQRSDPRFNSRRKLFTALHGAGRGSSIANLGEAALQADPAWVTIVDQCTRRIAGYIIASQVLEEERDLGPRLRKYWRERYPALQALKGMTESMLNPISEALASAGLSSQQQQDVSAKSAISVGISDSQMHTENKKMPHLPGVPGMLQRLLGSCCICGSPVVPASDNDCPGRCVHVSACHDCIKQIKPNQRLCMCLAIAISLKMKLRFVLRRGEKALTGLKWRKALMDNSSCLRKTAKLLVLAAALDIQPVIDTLLDDVVFIITRQLEEKLLPCLKAEEIVVLHGMHPNVTEHLAQRVAKAHADVLREHISCSGATHLGAGMPPATWQLPSPQLGLRVGYLAGSLDNAQLTSVLEGRTSKSGNEEEDIWLIISAEQTRAPAAIALVDLYCTKQRLLELKGDASQQAATVRALNLDIMVLMTFPNDDLEYILASKVALKTMNWRGMSGSRTDLCDFTLVSNHGAESADPDPRVIRVGFDQQVQATRIHSEGTATQGPNREALGLPAADFVVMFPGYLVQVDKSSLWTWMRLVAGLDRSVLALTAEQANMKAIVKGWVEDYAKLHGPFATDRVLLLGWQGSEIHAARIRNSDLCVATLNRTMPLAFFAAAVLSEAVGFLVLEGMGSADVRACGLGALLIAKTSEEFVDMGQAWATKRESACDFLREQQENRAGCFDPDRYSLSKIFRAVLAGEKPTLFDELNPVYDDNQKTRLAVIFEKISESKLNSVMFYKQGFKRILDYCERSGIKVQGLAGVGGSAYVVRAVLSRDCRGIKNVVVKISSRFQRVTTMHNSSVLRDAKNGRTISDRLRRSKSWHDLVPKPVYALHGGRSFVGHSEPNSSGHVILFSIFEDVERRFEDTLASIATNWLEDATVSNALVLACQDIFLALWHAHRNGLLVGDIKAQNIGQNPQGKAVFWDLGHGMCGPPKAGDAYGKPSSANGMMRRTSTYHFADSEAGGINPKGNANLYRVSGQGNRKVPFLFFTPNDLDRGEQLSLQKKRGLGRLGSGSFTNYDCKAAEERAEAIKKDPDASNDRERDEEEDVFQALRTILQVFNAVDWKSPVDWERRATAAASDPAQMLEFLKDGSRCTSKQPLVLERFADLLAIGLGPRPRPKLIDLMTHLALTSPALPPAFEQAIVHGEGFVFPGGTVGQVYTDIKKEWQELCIPPTCVRQEPDGKGTGEFIGVGLQAVNAITVDAFVAFYCGTKRSPSDGVGPMDTFPSRYGVSVRSRKQGEKFSIDGFAGRKLTVQWLNKHQATGAFMNAGGWKGGPASNIRLDRHNTWTDPATGIVWIPMYAICNIAAGEFLRWEYKPEDGEGGIYSFKCSSQKTRPH